MNTIIYAILTILLLYFVYFSIILPSIRQYIRYRFFALRDKLRLLYYDQQDKISEDLYECMQDSMNIFITGLHRFEIISWIFFQEKLRKDSKLCEKIRRRQILVKSCHISDFVSIRKEYERLYMWTLFFNSLPAIISLSPLLCILSMTNIAISNIRKVKDMLYTPLSDFDRIKASDNCRFAN